MSLLALYFPKVEYFNASIVAMLWAYLLVCVLGWVLTRRWSGRHAASIAVGGLAVLIPNLVQVVRESRDSKYHDLARRLSESDYSNEFLDVIIYLHAGWGCLHAGGGMLAGLLLCLLVEGLYQRIRKRPQQLTRNKSIVNSPTPS